MTEPNNSVQLVGRVSADPETKTMPSGDEIVTFRLVVRRGAAARRRSKQVVDTIECSAWSASARKAALRLSAGSEVAVSGALRRRFTRAGAGVVSWVSVEVATCKKVASPTVASSA